MWGTQELGLLFLGMEIEWPVLERLFQYRVWVPSGVSQLLWYSTPCNSYFSEQAIDKPFHSFWNNYILSIGCSHIAWFWKTQFSVTIVNKIKLVYQQLPCVIICEILCKIPLVLPVIWFTDSKECSVFPPGLPVINPFNENGDMKGNCPVKTNVQHRNVKC